MGDFDKAVGDGFKASATGAATGAAVAGTAAAIGALTGAALGPFAVVAAPIGAALGLLIGFFVSIGRKSAPTPEEIAAAKAKHEEAVKKVREMTSLFSWNSTALAKADRTNTIGMIQFTSYLALLNLTKKENPAWAPIIDAYIKAVTASTYNPPLKDPQLRKFRDFIQALAKASPTFTSDPMVYLRPPLSDVFGPALKAAGIDIANPKVIEIMRGNYDAVAAITMQYKPSPYLIRRKSYWLEWAKRTGKVRPAGPWDTRAFDPAIAPYGLGSFKMFPQLLNQPGWFQYTSPEFMDGTWGAPLAEPWPYGLDSDNFALPQGSKRPLSPKAKMAAAGVGTVGLIYLLFFL